MKLRPKHETKNTKKHNKYRTDHESVGQLKQMLSVNE